MTVANHVASFALDPGAPEPDESLLRRVRAGDADAFETLFRAYYGRLASLAFSFVKSREIAEEIVQDAMLRLWDQRGAIEVRGSVRSYLYASVRHRAITHLRHLCVVDRVEGEAVAAQIHADGWGGVLGRPVEGADVALIASELEAAIEAAIAELPSRCREAFVMSHRHELSHAEAATIMGTTVKTVENHLNRARRHLRLRLSAWLTD